MQQGHFENGVAGTPGSTFQTPSPSQGSGGSGAGSVGGPPPIHRGGPGGGRGAGGMHGQPAAAWRRCVAHTSLAQNMCMLIVPCVVSLPW